MYTAALSLPVISLLNGRESLVDIVVLFSRHPFANEVYMY